MRGLKVAGLTAISHFSKLLTALLIIKLIATKIGPDGMAFFGNYMSLISIASALAGGGVLSGAIKYLSEFSPDPVRQRYFMGSALTYSLMFSLVVVLTGLIFLDQITVRIFGGLQYTSYIYFFLLAQCIVAINNLAYGILNGLQKNARYALITVFGNLIAIVTSFISIYYFGMNGALVAITIPLLSPILSLLFLCNKKNSIFQFSFSYLWKDFSNLSRFSCMLIVSAVCFPVVEIYIRNDIVETVGWGESGIWQGLIRISSAYLSFYSIFLSFYLVPKISSTNDTKVIAKAVFLTMLSLSALFACMYAVVYLAKDQIVTLVLSKSFLPVADYLMRQMVGDYFRMMGWVIGFVVVAKASTKLYICSELFQGLCFIFLASVLLNHFGSLDGVVLGYVLTCFIYFVLCVVGFLIFLRMSNKER